ncbi:MAG: S-layer homology domain-containing protein [Firmicutes bacterium]|nr:S-layer homology domain-containing protein [Bacillota bacterium]
MKKFPYKRAFSILTAAFLSVNTFSAFANDVPPASAMSESAVKGIMEETLSLVKERIGDTSKYDKFTSDYELLSENLSDKNNISFRFDWKKTDTNETLSVSVSGGGIIKYLSKDGASLYTSENDKTDLAEKFALREQIRKKAQALLDKLNPDLKGHLFAEFSDSSDLFSFDITRYENNIKISDNGGSLRLSSDGNDMTYFDLYYTDNAEFSSADALLDTDSAKEAYKKAIPLRVKYFTSHKDKNEKEKKVYLAYTPDFSKGKFIYALNGELFDREMYSAADYEEESANYSMKATSANTADGFSQAELSELSELDSHYTIGEIKQILKSNKYLPLSDYILTNAYTSVNEYNERTINCSLKRNKKTESDNDNTSYDYASVVLNAETAEIISFSNSYFTYYRQDNDNNELAKIDYDILAKKAEMTAKEFSGNKFGEYRLATDTEKEKKKYIDNNYYYAASFTYTRYVNDIEYPDNYITVCINKYTGELTDYTITYLPDRSVFSPLPASALSPDEAYDMILSSYDFDLQYYAPYDEEYEKSGKKYFIPLYSLNHNSQYYSPVIRIDVTDGSRLYSSGEKIEEEITGNYTDTANSPYKNEIEALAFMDIGFTGDKFKPTEPITYKELYEALSFDNDKKESADIVTVGEFAKILSSSYVSDKISSSDIFIEKYPHKYNNYILIAQSLGFIEKSEVLDPDTPLTREEAAHTKYIICTEK